MNASTDPGPAGFIACSVTYIHTAPLLVVSCARSELSGWKPSRLILPGPLRIWRSVHRTPPKNPYRGARDYRKPDRVLHLDQWK